jgi:hypothetical protein
MASSSQVRSWWAKYECSPDRYVKVGFPGDGVVWNLSVASESAPIWKAVAQIMASEPYYFRESSGGIYNCRDTAGGSTSLHAFALALDLNPSKNPYDCPLRHNYPSSFIKRMEGIRANGKQAIQWGGRWPCSNPPDAMHWQINVAPSDVRTITWDTGGTVSTWKSKDGYTYPTDDWPPHDDGIKFVINGGIMLGGRDEKKKTGEFRAQDPIERGEFATVMYRFSKDVGLADEVTD